jgi:hypothetical protein
MVCPLHNAQWQLPCDLVGVVMASWMAYLLTSHGTQEQTEIIRCILDYHALGGFDFKKACAAGLTCMQITAIASDPCSCRG